MPKDDYVSFGGSLKIKGVKGSKVEKKKKKKKDKDTAGGVEKALEKAEQSDKDVKKDDEDHDAEHEEKQSEESEDFTLKGKTAAERRHEELKRRRFEERLEKEGYKTHKEKVEELNRYLSKLSEHHDMPRIGPG